MQKNMGQTSQSGTFSLEEKENTNIAQKCLDIFFTVRMSLIDSFVPYFFRIHTNIYGQTHRNSLYVLGPMSLYDPYPD